MEKVNLQFIKWFEDISLVGGKNASLGEMFQKLIPKEIQIPPAVKPSVTAHDIDELKP